MAQSAAAQLMRMPAGIVRFTWSAWMTGLGTAMMVGRESLGMVEKMFNRRDELEDRGQELADRTWGDLEFLAETIGEEVESILARLKVPTRADFDAVSKRLEDLAQELGASVTAKTRTTYHVTTEDDGWKVTREGSDEILSRYDTKDDAVTAARGLAHAHQPSHLIIHRMNGTIQEHRSYGEVAEERD